jgi:signal transduction histidine kinase
MFDEPSSQVLFLYRVFNLLIGVTTFSLAAAFAWYARSGREKTNSWMLWFFAAFFVTLGASRILRAYGTAYDFDNFVKLLPDALSAVLALVIGILVWPMVRFAAGLPSRSELQSTVQELRVAQHELEEARDKAMENSALKSAFVANISHEIRTPLSGIIGMNELLVASELDEEQHELAVTVQQSSRQLLAVLNDILDLSKIEAGRMHLESVPFDPSQVIADAVRLMEPAARSKELVLKKRSDFVLDRKVMGDPGRFRQVLLDLLSNAIKFTETGEVSIEAVIEAEDHDAVTLRVVVSDTGIGMTEKDQMRLFEPFSQADNSTTRKFGGTGLGLTISKRLIEMMAGRIGLSSKYGAGSTFWFVVPFKKEPAQEIPRQDRWGDSQNRRSA